MCLCFHFIYLNYIYAYTFWLPCLWKLKTTGCIAICHLSTLYHSYTEYRIPNSFYNALLGFIFSHSSRVFYSFISSFDKTNIDVLIESRKWKMCDVRPSPVYPSVQMSSYACLLFKYNVNSIAFGKHISTHYMNPICLRCRFIYFFFCYFFSFFFSFVFSCGFDLLSSLVFIRLLCTQCSGIRWKIHLFCNFLQINLFTGNLLVDMTVDGKA